MTTAIVWFRKCLRVHDNQPLHEAVEMFRNGDIDNILPVFVFDPLFTKRGFNANRFKFLQDTLKDLRKNLKKLGLPLYYFHEDVFAVMKKLISKHDVGYLMYEMDSSEFACDRDDKMDQLCKKMNVEVCSYIGHTLFDPWKKASLSFSTFSRSIPEVPQPLEIPRKVNVKIIKEYEREIDLPTRGATTHIEGGETIAVQIMNSVLNDAQFVKTFMKEKTDPTTLDPSTTMLSPYICMGALSVRGLYHEIISMKEDHGPPGSLSAQLLWRDFFYAHGATVPNFGQMKGNPICKQIKWKTNKQHFEAWRNAETGYPWIDAIMTQLREEGWIHHLARHCVACFLTRGQLFISWERGVEVFNEMLLDGDTSVNIGNWLWVSASAFYNQYWKVYSPTNFPKKYDKDGEYVRKYLPVLKNLPSEYIYEPWLAPDDVLKEAGVKLGKNYPYPIIDADEATKENMAKWKSMK
jgi:cryptochrome